MALPLNSQDQTGFGVTERMLLATPPANLSAPALAPPPSVVPNFENPPNGNTTASVAFIVMMVVSTLCFFLRAYGKLYPRRMIYFEDGKSATSLFILLPRSEQLRTDRFLFFQFSSYVPTYVTHTPLPISSSLVKMWLTLRSATTGVVPGPLTP